MFKSSIPTQLKAILIPGLVFQSVVTGGGFATGREIVQYCVRHGIAFPWILTTVFICFAILTFLIIETARLFQTFDYRTWGQKIIPRFWVGLDILFIAMAVLVCAIVISGAVEVVRDVIAVPALLGLFVAIAIVVLITAGGKRFVLATKIFGACFLTLGYLSFALSSFFSLTPNLWSIASTSGQTDGWLRSSFEYVGYNTVALPACLYTFSYVKTRKQSFFASIVSGFMLIIPMLFVALSVLSLAPESLSSPVPLHDVVIRIGNPFLLILYYSILVWTLLDTAVGMVFAIMGRIESHVFDRKKVIVTVWHRVFFAILFVVASTLLAKVGIIDLVAKGYSAMSYCFILFLVLPLLTIGVKTVYIQKEPIN